jgi:two-component system sensor histidine kinase PilS (NtrC family)
MRNSTAPLAVVEKTDQQQNLSLLKIYTLYRVLLCIALLTTFLLDPYKHPLLAELRPALFLYSTGFYLVLNLVTLIIVLPKHIQLNNQQLFINFFIDLLALILIIDSSGGITSGVAILLVVVIAASSIMLRGQLALLIAALASLAIIADTITLTSQKHLDTSSFLTAGLLGISLFITSFFIQNLASRIRGTQLLAEQRAVDVSQLQRLNQQIVQRMRTGIVVTDHDGRIYLANASASELLATPELAQLETQRQLPTLQPVLMKQFQQWLQSPQYKTPPFRTTDTGPEVQASFTPITTDDRTDILIFLEDNRRLAQQAQQMKLASLGRLTASIAHEIRNPLGAISHASQLLQESVHLQPGDQRLCQIIHNHSDRMNRVIENVLQLSSRSAPKPEKVSLKRWLEQFIEEFTTAAHATAKIHLHIEQDCLVTIDTSQLNQVLTNLVQNGLRYSLQQTGQAILTLRVHINTNTRLPVLDIIDEGPGVAEPSLDKLFEPFYTTETSGSGLGLYISRELCQANEARLDYIRTDEGKSCFRISFPHPERRLSPE